VPESAIERATTSIRQATEEKMQRDRKVLERLCVHAAMSPGAVGAVIYLIDEDFGIRLVAASDDRAARMAHCHSGASDGPAVQVCRSGRSVTVDDVASAALPHLRRAASEHGVSAIAAMPIFVHDDVVGALELYRDRSGRWTRHDLGVGDTLAEIATVLMSLTSDLDRAEAMIEQLRNTLENRAVIEQAKGMISRDHQVSVKVAFEMLRRHSRNTNTPVRVLARAVTDLAMQIPDFSDGSLRRQRQPVARGPAGSGSPDFVAQRS
jgi:GAF domain-containing protein